MKVFIYQHVDRALLAECVVAATANDRCSPDFLFFHVDSETEYDLDSKTGVNQKKSYTIHVHENDAELKAALCRKIQVCKMKMADFIRLQNLPRTVEPKRKFTIPTPTPAAGRDVSESTRQIVKSVTASLDKTICKNASKVFFPVTRFSTHENIIIFNEAYLLRLVIYNEMRPSLLIVAIFFLNNFFLQEQQRNAIDSDFLHAGNANRYVFMALAMAQKMYDDTYYNNASMARIAGVPKQEFNELEVDFWKGMMKFNLYISNEMYVNFLIVLGYYSEEPKMIVPFTLPFYVSTVEERQKRKQVLNEFLLVETEFPQPIVGLICRYGIFQDNRTATLSELDAKDELALRPW